MPSIDVSAARRGVSARLLPALPWVWLAIGAGFVWRYAWLLDDAFVYFRYADNAAILGAGLVYNDNEFVEGYTSPLWMLLLTALRYLGLSFWTPIICIGVTSLTASWWLALRTNAQLGHGGPVSVNFPAIFLCCCYAVQSHFTSGLETPLVQLAAWVFGALVLTPTSRPLQALMGLAPLIRPELNLPLLVAAVWCSRQARRPPWTLLATAFGTQAAWLSFRVIYYAALLPNTFHLKDEASWARGLHYVHDTLRAYHLYGFLALFVIALGCLWALGHRDRAHLGPRSVLWIGAALLTGYVVRIGGDFVHYRYLAFPIGAILCSFGGIADDVLGKLRRGRGPASVGAALSVAAVLLVAYPPQLPRHPLLLTPSWDLRRYHLEGIEDAASHRLRPDLRPGNWGGGVQFIPTDLLRNGYQVGLTTGWCFDAYRHLDAYVINEFGLTDFVLSRIHADTTHAGHRWSLAPFARDLLAMRSVTGTATRGEPVPVARVTGRGIFIEAARAGRAPRWMVRHVAALERLGLRAYNEHDALENLRLALDDPGALGAPASP